MANISFEKAKRWWNIQKDGKWKQLVAPLKKSAAIHRRLNQFIKFFYWNFRRKKGVLDHHYPKIDFLGFTEFEDPVNKSTAGHCDWKSNDEGIVKMEIFLNHWFLLDKFNMTHLVRDEVKEGKETSYGTLNIDFNELIGTIAHELAHAYQGTVNPPNEKQSQCESTGERDENGELVYKELVYEHTQLTNEIEQIITSSLEYRKFKKWWREEKLPSQKKGNNIKCKYCERISDYNPCQECIEEREYQRLSLLIQKSKDLLNLDKNYQDAKKSTTYKKFDKKIGIDNLYHETKVYLSEVQKDNDELKRNIGLSLLCGGILIFGLLIARILPRRKRKKY